MTASIETGANPGNATPFGRGLFAAALTWSLIALACLLLFSLSGSVWREVALSAMILFASAAVGTTAGFIFGVPKSIAVLSGDSVNVRVYRPNSSLETISDWLTKIIVGVGLIEFRQLIDGIGWLGVRIGLFFGDQTAKAGIGAAYGITLILGGTLISFLIAYMWTRTRLYQVLAQYEQNVT